MGTLLNRHSSEWLTYWRGISFPLGWHLLDRAAEATGDGDNSDYFGQEVSIDGNLALIGASTNDGGGAYLFGWNGERWQQKAKLTACDGQVGDGLGRSVSLSHSMALVGAADKAYAYQLLHLSNSIYLPLISR